MNIQTWMNNFPWTFKPHIMRFKCSMIRWDCDILTDLLLMLIKIMMLYYDHIWKLWWFHNDERIMFLIRWELRHLHSPNYALLTDARATSEDVYPIGRFILYDYQVIIIFIVDDDHHPVSFRYKWQVYNPECNTIDTEIFLTLSRSPSPSPS